MSRLLQIRTLIKEVGSETVSNPKVALLSARQAVEAIANELGEAGGISRSSFADLNKFLEGLEKNGKLDRKQATALHKIRQLANPVIHGEKPATTRDASKALELLSGLGEFWITPNRATSASAAQREYPRAEPASTPYAPRPEPPSSLHSGSSTRSSSNSTSGPHLFDINDPMARHRFEQIYPPPPSQPKPIRRDPHPDIQPWKWIGGIVGFLLIILVVRSCVSTLTSRTSPTPQQPQASVSSPTDVATIAVPTFYETSFNCSRATFWAEQQVCSTQSLADSDRQQAELYSSLMSRAGGADRDSLRQSQRDWLKARNTCSDVSCIEQLYGLRMLFLQGWTPTPIPTDDANHYAAPQSSQPDTQNAPPADTITCILPYGQEMQASRRECERLGGSVYN